MKVDLMGRNLDSLSGCASYLAKEMAIYLTIYDGSLGWMVGELEGI